MVPVRLVVSLILWLVGIFLMWRIPTLRRKERAAPRAAPWPRLSVIIPARNEALRISPLLASLAQQSAAPHEILVVDDNSSDDTAAVARRLGARVLPGQPLPPGWAGKNWACWQGAQQSAGDLLLFLDADTWLEPQALAGLVEARERCGGLLTVQPYHVTRAAYEQLSAFFNIVLMASLNAFTPLRRWLKPGGGFGPCLLCPREEYFALGGHSVVKEEVLEDLALAKRALRRGIPVACYGGRGAVSFRMYPGGLRDLLEGWSKGFGAGAFSVQIPFLILSSAWITGLFRALGDLLRALFAPGMTNIGWAAPMYALFALQVAWMLARIGRFRAWTSALYPIPLLFFALVMARSFVLIHILHRVTWRGRTIATPRREMRPK